MKYVLTLFVAIVFFPSTVSAAILFESGTLGSTDVTWQQALDGEVVASSVSSTVFTGVRFELNQPVLTTQIGGHFFAPASGTFFGAIIELDDVNDFPDSDDLTTPDVLGATLLTFPVPSAEVYGNLSLSLDPGWYALVFGSGLFGALGDGGVVGNGTDIGNPTYIGYQQGSGWLNLAPLPLPFEDFRLVINGIVIPEPSTIGLTLAATLFFLFREPLGIR